MDEQLNEAGLSLDAVRAYRVLCEFCALLLGESPSDETFARLADERDLLFEEPFASVAPEAAGELHALLARAGEGDEAVMVEARRDYTYLFYMVAASHTAPFESVYRTDDRTMFGPTTLQVRETLRRWGVEVPGAGSVPDDHAAYELAFIAQLLAAKEALLEGGVNAEALPGDPLAEVTAFLSQHVLVWMPVYLANVGVRAQEPFYRVVAALAAASVASLAEALDAQPVERIDEAYRILS